MIDRDETATSSRPDAGQAAEVLAMSPLPALSHGEHRAASATIEELVDALQHGPRHQVGFETQCALVSHLRRIGDPASAEVIARLGFQGFRAEGRLISAVTMLNLAGLACFDQGAYEDSDECFGKALGLIPPPDAHGQTPAVLVNHATLMTEMGRFEQALLLYDEAMRTVVESPRGVYGTIDSMLPEEVMGLISNNVGWVFIRSARERRDNRSLLKRAEAALTTALSGPLAPRTRIIALANRAEVLVRIGDHVKAERVLAPLEAECLRTGHQRLLPEVHRRWAQLCAARGERAGAVEWARKAMQSSLLVASPRQERRIVEVFMDILRDILAGTQDARAVLESTGEPVMTNVLELLQSKDTYTGGNHSVQVASLSRRIAGSLARGDPGRRSWVSLVELHGLFHDFGKLRIPWCLLNKVSSLTGRDWRLLRAHTTIGEEMLSGLGLPTLGYTAGSHHERLDGEGYPKGTTGASLEASIVAVADAFEAMTSPSRIYARPKTSSQALGEVVSKSGTQFRPDVVNALTTLATKNSPHPRPS